MNQEAPLRWDHGLEGPAKRIAELDHTPIRVLAGPGTGKTFAMMRRVARLLQEGSTAGRILVCTFTRTAAKDLENALAKLNAPDIDAVYAETLHAFCFRLLCQADVLEITGRIPRTLLKFEERFLLEDLKLGGYGKIRDLRRLLRARNAAWARLQSETPSQPITPEEQSFKQDLDGWLRFHEAMHIGELIPKALQYLRQNPASPHRGLFEHVLIDEYQDLNRADQVLLDLLAREGQLVVVGDENQSIYSFRFAYPDGIAKFDQSHPGTQNINLDECRRCPRLVVEMANALISNNQSRVPRTLTPRPENPDGKDKVHILQWDDMHKEAQGIAKIIHTRIQRREVNPGKVLVLAPRRQFGYEIRDALNVFGVSAHSFFQEEELDTDDAQQAFTLLTLLANPDDRVALRCWCDYGVSSSRSPAWKRLRNYCENTRQTPREALEHLASDKIRIPYSNHLVKSFQKLQTRLIELENLRSQALVDVLFPGNQGWALPLRDLASTIEENEFDAKTLHKGLRTRIVQPELPMDVDYVRVMSLHKSKGLTADLVAVVGCVEGLFPRRNTTGDTLTKQTELLEEQRRLFYVAITRARQSLFLSSVTQLPKVLALNMGLPVRNKNRAHVPTITSSFLNELGPSSPTPVLGTTFLEKDSA